MQVIKLAPLTSPLERNLSISQLKTKVSFIMFPKPHELAQRLVRLNTANPPGNEALAACYLAELLLAAGFDADIVQLDDRRSSLLADFAGNRDGPVQCFSGHLDTVPFGEARWQRSPLSGDIVEGRLFGRGAADMKGGVAAIVSAAIRASKSPECLPLRLILTAGEETGCVGAASLESLGLLRPAGTLIVAEPTSNMVCPNHRGVLWLKATFTGRSAHGSMPDLGDNAVVKAAAAITKLQHFIFSDVNDDGQKPSLNVGYCHGGASENIVPDYAEIGLDIRTVPSQRGRNVRDQIAAFIGSSAQIETILELDGVRTDPDDPWVRAVSEDVHRITGISQPLSGLPYFTDASVLTKALGNPPTLILGPGDPRLAHQTDEWCSVEQIDNAADIFESCMRALPLSGLRGYSNATAVC